MELHSIQNLLEYHGIQHSETSAQQDNLPGHSIDPRLVVPVVRAEKVS